MAAPRSPGPPAGTPPPTRFSGRFSGRRTDPERAMRTCPTCGKELAERKCKLYCPDPICGYFLSCADYY